MRGDREAQKQALAALEHAAALSAAANWPAAYSLRQVPELHFEQDKNPDVESRIDFLLTAGKKISWARRKISPKYKQIVLVLFLLALPAAYGQQELLRLEKSADAMGSTYSMALYGEDRVKMEAAVDAAFDEVRRLDELLSNYQAGQRVERGQPERGRAAGQGFAGAVPAAGGLRRVQPGERRCVRYHGGTADEGLGVL